MNGYEKINECVREREREREREIPATGKEIREGFQAS